MGHNHAEKNIGVALVINAVFAVIEFGSAWLTGSMAVLSDAFHDLGDVVILYAAFSLQHLSHRPPTESMTYGYGRYSLLGALLSAVVIIAGSAVAIPFSIARFLEPRDIHTEGMMAIAFAGALFNAGAAWFLSHGHSHNERFVSLHLLEDVLGWIAVFAGAIAIHLWGVLWLDPLLSVLISVFLISRAVPALFPLFRVFVQSSPQQGDYADIRNLLASELGVQSVHHLHVWSLNGEDKIVTAHLILDTKAGKSASHIREKLKTKLFRMGVSHATIETDTELTDSAVCSLPPQ